MNESLLHMNTMLSCRHFILLLEISRRLAAFTASLSTPRRLFVSESIREYIYGRKNGYMAPSPHFLIADL